MRNDHMSTDSSSAGQRGGRSERRQNDWLPKETRVVWELGRFVDCDLVVPLDCWDVFGRAIW